MKLSGYDQALLAQIGHFADMWLVEQVRIVMVARNSAEARLEAPEAALRDIAEHGLRADLTPTMDCRDTGALYAGFASYLRRLDDSIRERAAAALSGVAS